jgi:type IV secretion system protein VirB1
MLAELLVSCAPALHPHLSSALVKRESGFNQFSIGMDAKHKVHLVRQPKNITEAVATAESLQKQGYKFSVGLTQIHISNVQRYAMSWAQAFEPCASLKASQTILVQYHEKALKTGLRGNDAVYAALRGYNCGHIQCAASNGYAAAILTSAMSGQTTMPGSKTVRLGTVAPLPYLRRSTPEVLSHEQQLWVSVPTSLAEK